MVAPSPTFAGRHRVWVLLVLVGLVSSVLAKLVNLALGWLLQLRLGVLGLGTTYGAAGRLGLWVGWSLAAVSLALALTENVNPAAKGSGIPQMKALLAGGIRRGRYCHRRRRPLSSIHKL
jgi:H+/Cl- antiporter ClcA